MTPAELIEAVEEAGGTLELRDDRVRYQMPPAATHLLEELRGQREQVKALLLERRIMAALPSGVRLVNWEPRTPPVALTRYSVVNDVDKFIESTLHQLGDALAARQSCYLCRREAGGKPRGYFPTPEELRTHLRHRFRTGNWSIKDLVERLEEAGLRLEIDNL
jgi:hypothetical protein